uniref:Uncharacterized protein n=1 Tax=Arundo donax TaxID=35708 RepID=A0A0A8Z599_ARUDO
MPIQCCFRIRSHSHMISKLHILTIGQMPQRAAEIGSTLLPRNV